jgi:hypothetical protein
MAKELELDRLLRMGKKIKKRLRPVSDRARTKETSRLETAAKVFLEYHENSSWAHQKLQSGTAPLSPESVVFMQEALGARQRLALYDAKLKAELEAEYPPTNPVGGTK